MKSPIKYELKQMTLANLKPHPDQIKVRTITSEARNGLAGSLEKFGLLQDIIVNKRNKRIVSGHQRVSILKSKGIKSAEVKVIDVDTKTEKAIFYTLNNEEICGKFTPDAKPILESLNVELGALSDCVGLNLLENVLPVMLIPDENPEDVEFKEFDESEEKKVKKIKCPYCGREFVN